MSVMELADSEGGDRKLLRQRDGQQVAEVWSTITHTITGQVEAYFQQLKARPDRRGLE
jgi:hypothetical protein